jgi:hypothetical protein
MGSIPSLVKKKNRYPFILNTVGIEILYTFWEIFSITGRNNGLAENRPHPETDPERKRGTGHCGILLALGS